MSEVSREDILVLSSFKRGIKYKSELVTCSSFDNWKTNLLDVFIDKSLNTSIARNKYAWSPIVWESRRSRSSYDFLFSDFLVLDIDDGISLDESINLLKDYDALILSTKNHLKAKKTNNGIIHPPKERFRIIIPFTKRIHDLATYKATMHNIKDLFPWADNSCFDPARIYWGSLDVLFISKGTKKWDVMSPENSDLKYEKDVLYGNTYCFDVKLNCHQKIKKAFRKVQFKNFFKKSFYLLRHNNSIENNYTDSRSQKGIINIRKDFNYGLTKKAEYPTIYIRKNNSPTWYWLPSSKPLYRFDTATKKLLFKKMVIDNSGFFVFTLNQKYQYCQKDFFKINHVVYKLNSGVTHIFIPYHVEKNKDSTLNVKEMQTKIHKILSINIPFVEFHSFFAAIPAVPDEIIKIQRSKKDINTSLHVDNIYNKLSLNAMLDYPSINITHEFNKISHKDDDDRKTILELKIQKFYELYTNKFIPVVNTSQKIKVYSSYNGFKNESFYFNFFLGELPSLGCRFSKSEKIWLRFFLSSSALFFKGSGDVSLVYSRKFKISVSAISKYFKKYNIRTSESSGRRVLKRLLENKYIKIEKEHIAKKSSRVYSFNESLYVELFKLKNFYIFNKPVIKSFKIIDIKTLSITEDQAFVKNELIKPPSTGTWNNYIFQHVKLFTSLEACVKYYTMHHNEFLFEKKERIKQLESAWLRRNNYRLKNSIITRSI